MRILGTTILVLWVSLSAGAQDIDPLTGTSVSRNYSGSTPLVGLFGQRDWFGNYVPRAGFRYDTGDSIGREGGLSSFQGFVPLFEGSDSNWLTFFDGRFLLDSDQGNVGSNLGLGGRLYLPGLNRTIGAYLYYDYRDTGVANFDQLSGGVESLGQIWDWRANWYAPNGANRVYVGSLGGPAAHFGGHYLYLGGDRLYEAAMSGFDTELGAYLTTVFGTQLRAFGGCYHFQAAGSQQAWGWKSRVEGRVMDNIALNLAIQNDRVFDTTVNFSVAIYAPRLSGRRSHTRRNCIPVKNRLAEPVERIQTIVVDRQRTGPAVAINPLTGDPLYFVHVDQGNSDGSFEDPYSSLTQAIHDPDVLDGNTVIYDRRTDSESGMFNIAGNNRILSGGPVQIVDTQIGPVQLPFSGTGNSPTLVGNVSLGSNSLFSGFDIESSEGGHSISVANAGNVRIEHTRIDGDGTTVGLSLTDTIGPITVADSYIYNLGGRVVDIDNAGGSVEFVDTNISNNNGLGISVTNSAGNVAFGNVLINGPAEAGLTLSDNTGTVSFTNVDVTTEKGEGLLVTDSANVRISSGTITTTERAAVSASNTNLDVTLESLTSQDSTSDGVLLDNVSGNLTVTGNTTITNPADRGIEVTDSNVSGTFGSEPGSTVSITGRGSDGIFLDNANGTFSFGDTTIGAPIASSSSAFFVSNTSDADISFDSLTIPDSDGDALSINNSSGSVTIGGGSITVSTAGRGLAITDSNIAMALTDVPINVTSGDSAIWTQNATGNLIMSGSSSVTVSGLSPSEAGVVLDADGIFDLTIPTVTINANTGTNGIEFSGFTAGSDVYLGGGSITRENATTGTVSFIGPTNGTFDLSNVTLNGFNSRGITIGPTQSGSYKFGNVLFGNVNDTSAMHIVNTNADVTVDFLQTSNTLNGVLIDGLTGSFSLNEGTIANVNTGVNVKNSQNISINEVTFSALNNHAVRAEDVSNFTITDNTITDVSDEGILVVNGSGTGVISGNQLTASISAFDDGIKVSTTGTTDLTIDNNQISSLVSVLGDGINVDVNGSGNNVLRIRDNTITSISGNFGSGIQVTNDSTGLLTSTITGNTINNSVDLFTDGIRFALNAGSANTTIAMNTIDSDNIVNLMGNGIFLSLNTTGATSTTIDQNVISNDVDAALFADGVAIAVVQGVTHDIFVTNNRIGEFAGIFDDGVEILSVGGGGTEARIQVNDNLLQGSAGITGSGLNLGAFVSDTYCAEVMNNTTDTDLDFFAGIGGTINVEDLPNVSANNNGATVNLLGPGTIQNIDDCFP